MIENILAFLFEKITNAKPGIVFAILFFIIALLWCIFGFYKMFFILIFTIIGFFVGSFIFNDDSKFKRFLDRILPPGRFR